MTLLVRDEQDILRTNIDFHLRQGVDFIIATDNKSVDATSEILKFYERQGVLQYIYEGDDDYSQDLWVTRMARMAYNQGADWIINNDADEFWRVNSGQSLKTYLDAIPPDIQALIAERFNFIPRPEIKGKFFYETMLMRETKSLNALGDPLPPKICHRAFSDIEVAQGNHSVSRVSGEPVSVTASNIDIAHFPLRSYAQFENKIIMGGSAYERNDRLDKNIGGTWRNLYKIYQEGGLKDYYQSQLLSDNEIKKALQQGILVEDNSLNEY